MSDLLYRGRVDDSSRWTV